MPLKITVRSVLPTRESGDIIVVGVPKLGGAKKKNARSPIDGFDRALGGALGRAMKKHEFKGRVDDWVALGTLGGLKAERLVVLGVGPSATLGPFAARSFAAKAARRANSDRCTRLVLGVPPELEGFLAEIVQGLELGAYRFTKYLTGERLPKIHLAQVTICIQREVPRDAKAIIDRAQAVAVGVNLARDLSNEPSNVLYPATLADAARTMAKDAGLEVQVFDFKEIQKRGMELLQAVGQGSEHKPCLVHMSWKPANPKRRLVFVGKGVTFDSGGLSIKPAAGMGEMKHDMSGAANVVGLMRIVGALKPDVEVHGIFAAAENMPDGNAYRPGDIWRSLDGKTVEIINTDAEGRLILADALAYARTLEPDFLIDNATLTGACVVALGNSCSGWYASNEAAAQEFATAVNASGEQMWRMPLIEELKDQLKTGAADLRHTGDRWGGSISAALFLREFIGNVRAWVHCDIAGPAMGDRARGWDPKGGTGHGVLTFLSLIEAASNGQVSVAEPQSADANEPPTGTKDGVKKSAADGRRAPKVGTKGAAKVAKKAVTPSPRKKKSAPRR